MLKGYFAGSILNCLVRTQDIDLELDNGEGGGSMCMRSLNWLALFVEG
jgi:hypothetical protein